MQSSDRQKHFRGELTVSLAIVSFVVMISGLLAGNIAMRTSQTQPEAKEKEKKTWCGISCYYHTGSDIKKSSEGRFRCIEKNTVCDALGKSIKLTFLKVWWSVNENDEIDTENDYCAGVYEARGKDLCTGSSSSSSPTRTPSPSLTPNLTTTATPTATPASAANTTQTPTPTSQNTSTPTLSPTPTSTPSATPTITNTPTLTPTPEGYDPHDNENSNNNSCNTPSIISSGQWISASINPDGDRDWYRLNVPANNRQVRLYVELQKGNLPLSLDIYGEKNNSCDARNNIGSSVSESSPLIIEKFVDADENYYILVKAQDDVWSGFQGLINNNLSRENYRLQFTIPNAPAATPTPSNTLTPEPTSTPLPTETPTPEYTATPTPTITLTPTATPTLPAGCVRIGGSGSTNVVFVGQGFSDYISYRGFLDRIITNENLGSERINRTFSFIAYTREFVRDKDYSEIMILAGICSANAITVNLDACSSCQANPGVTSDYTKASKYIDITTLANQVTRTSNHLFHNLGHAYAKLNDENGLSTDIYESGTNCTDESDCHTWKANENYGDEIDCVTGCNGRNDLYRPFSEASIMNYPPITSEFNKVSLDIWDHVDGINRAMIADFESGSKKNQCKPADQNGDGSVNVIDFMSLSFQYGTEVTSQESVGSINDLNCDGYINASDLAILISNLGREE